MTQIVFHSSLPRSGSTLLQNLAAQCESNHVTPTSDVIELVVAARNHWMEYPGFKAQGIDRCAPNIKRALRGIVEGYYSQELAVGKTIWEKSRGWIAYLELLDEIFEAPQRIVCCVRDVRDIVASFEKLHRKSSLTKRDAVGDAYFDCQTIQGRAMQLLSKEAVVGLAINRLRDALAKGYRDRLLIVPYHGLTSDPVGTMARLHYSLGLPPIMVDPSNVEQVTREDDGQWGMDLHTVRPVVEANEETWRGVLPDGLAEWINECFY